MWREDDFGSTKTSARSIVRNAARWHTRGSRAFEGWRVAVHASAFQSPDLCGPSQMPASQASRELELEFRRTCSGSVGASLR